MRLKIFIYVLSLAITVLVFQPACKTSDEAEENRFNLTVILAEGVGGDPVAGTYTYDQGDVVTYSYTMQAGYGNLTVTLDGTEVPASGTVTMNSDHVLAAAGTGLSFDLRGAWTGVFIWPLINPTYIMDIYFRVQFTGEPSSGKVIASLDTYPWKMKGIYTVEGNEVRFEINSGFPVPPVTAVLNPGNVRSPIGAIDNKNRPSPLTGLITPNKMVFWGTALDNNRLEGRWEGNGGIISVPRKGIIINTHGTFYLDKQ